MEDSGNSIRNNGIWLWVTAAALLGLLAAGAWVFWVRAGLVPLNPLCISRSSFWNIQAAAANKDEGSFCVGQIDLFLFFRLVLYLEVSEKLVVD
jgi:hypothetical protein